MGVLFVYPTVAGGGGGGSDTLLTSFDATNWDGANTSPGRIRKPLGFKAGDMPAGSVPVLKVAGVEVDAQFDERSTWPADGSLRLCVAHIRDSQFAAAETRTYDVYARTGTFSNTGTKALSDITGTEDFKVAYSSLTQYNGTTTTTRGSGAALAEFNTAAATATRVTKYHEGDVCEGWEVWHLAKDGSDGSGTEDAHLQTVWYVDIWKNADGSIADIEYGAKPAQVWWSVASKFRLNYTATLKNGATTIATYSTIQHPYNSEWLTVRTDDDNGHGKRHWKTAMPTLFTTMDKAYWISTGLIPPLDTTFTPDDLVTIYGAATYVPCSAQDHRADTDGTGAYMGRGMMPNTDCIAFMRQTAADYRVARVNAFAGLHIPYHFRSNNTRTRSGETADTANTVISLILDPMTSTDYDFTADGMPAAVSAYRGGSAVSGVKDSYVSPTGGTGVFSFTTNDSSHAVNFCYFMYLLEGERYFMQATLELPCNVTQQSNGNEFGGRPRLLYSGVTNYDAAFSIPTTAYGGTIRGSNNCRQVGWAHMLFGSASAIVPDNDVQSGYIRLLAQQNADYAERSCFYMPASQKASGWWRETPGSPAGSINSPWMVAVIVQGLYHHWRCTGDADAKTAADQVANVAIGAFESLNYLSNAYRAMPLPKGSAEWASGTNEFFDRGGYCYLLGPVTLDAATDTFTHASGAGTLGFNFAIANGDEIYFSGEDDLNGTATIPAEITDGTKYYVVNANAVAHTFQVSATLGGTAITFSTNASDIFVGIRMADFDHAVAADPPNLPGADDYPGICYAALVMANAAGVTDATDALVDAAEAFIANVDQSGWATWKFKRAA